MAEEYTLATPGALALVATAVVVVVAAVLWWALRVRISEGDDSSDRRSIDVLSDEARRERRRRALLRFGGGAEPGTAGVEGNGDRADGARVSGPADPTRSVGKLRRRAPAQPPVHQATTVSMNPKPAKDGSLHLSMNNGLGSGSGIDGAQSAASTVSGVTAQASAAVVDQRNTEPSDDSAAKVKADLTTTPAADALSPRSTSDVTQKVPTCVASKEDSGEGPDKKRAKAEVAAAKEKSETADTDTAASKDTGATRRGQRPVAPPAQLLCEALSRVSGARVAVTPGPGSWGGEGWVQKRKGARLRPTSSPATQRIPNIVLPLIGQRPSHKMDSEWSQLACALESVVSSSSASTNPFRSTVGATYKKGDVSTAASWHSKTRGSAARDIINDAAHVLGSSRNDELASATKEGLGRCLAVMTEHLSTAIAQWLDGDLARAASREEEEEEESDDDDLFSDLYDGAGATTDGAARLSSVAADTALGELLKLCGTSKATSVLPKKLLDDIIARSSDGPLLAKGLLERAFDRLPAPESTESLTFESVAQEAAAVSHLTGNSVAVAMALSGRLKAETDLDSSPTGNALELAALLRPLLVLGGHTLPRAGFELGQPNSTMPGYRFYEALTSLEAFPLGYCDYSRAVDPSIEKSMDEARSFMRLARSTASRVLGHCMRKNGGNGKDNVFRWLGRLARVNEMHANLLQEQLLDGKDAVHDTISSRPFVMGAAVSVLEMCCQNLVQQYDKNGVDTFDPRYLVGSNPLVVPSDERRLIDLDGAKSIANIPKVYSGATEFFFLTTALLRVSVFPAIRIRDEYSQKYKKIMNHLSQLAKEDSERNSRMVREVDKKIVAGLLGWNVCLDDRELMGRLVDFSILQLRFLADLSEGQGKEVQARLALIPESMVKLPAQYIALVAKSFQHCLSPRQAEVAVQHATAMLGSGLNFAIQVQIELIRIAGAFIEASVKREDAKQRRKLRAGRRRGASDDEDSIIDRRDHDIYCSLDPNDHGVVVFASPVTSTKLGPSLIKTFIAMEAVEGLDVERDNHFHKNNVQSEISELILRLWMHPSGSFKRSITELPSDTLNEFFKSVAAAISIESDTVYQTIVDIRDILEHHVTGSPFSRPTMATLQSSYDRLPAFLGSLRRLLLLLIYLCQEERIAAILGGGHDESASSDLGIMIVGLLHKLTASDGGTHPLVDFRVALKRVSTVASDQTSTLNAGPMNELINARMFVEVEFGLDVSILSHVLIALATRWTLAARRKTDKNPSLIKVMTSHDDFDIRHFKSVFDRLVVATLRPIGAGDEQLVAQADGHVDFSVWAERYKTPSGIGLEESRRQRRYSSGQDQLTRDTISSTAQVDQMKAFIDDLERSLQCKVTKYVAKSPAEVMLLERQLLEGQGLDEEGYTGYLKDWIVSSDSFSSDASNMMDHFYSAKAGSNAALGKVLLKDARRCWKDIPRPHPNASIFVCYAEERIDMCKAVIVGATGTPYAGGLFLFDVCYPQLYPNAAPMVHFMTTGGGQVRFSPNLYNDGKVCLSLLGTTTAWDESQRWNPNQSSLATVLLSIQSQILDVAEPYFAEGGGHGGLQGTRAGQQGSARYNNTLRLSTLRHAILEPLKSPHKGFEDVTRRHFAMCRKRLLVQAKVWTLEATGTELQGRFERAYSELLALLSGDSLACEEWEVTDAGGSVFGALPPLPDDLQALEHLDRSSYDAFNTALLFNDSHHDNEPRNGLSFAEEEEALNAAMLARALELSLLENV